jgi:cell fate regulator YaaT (PSP1 superfamily)
MRSLGLMGTRDEAIFPRGAQVIVRTNRGLEFGFLLCQADERTAPQLEHSSGQIVRAATDDDFAELARIEQQRQKRIADCEKHIAELKLDMKLVEVEQLYGGERIVIYYLAEERVDFRQLVKLLAADFKTRIEMKQIGVRDEAKLLADYGDCGKPVCCNTHLSAMPPVSMRMAKLQKATLDPTKISGRCGRLKCCLRYEFDHYDQVHRTLPRIGARVVTRNGKAQVLGQHLLTEQLLVETEDHRRLLISANEVLTVIAEPKS